MKRKIAVMIGWILVWELLSRIVSNPVVFAGPADTLCAFFRLAGTSGFWGSCLQTFIRAMGGIVCGMILALLFAFISIRIPWGYDVVSPLVRVVKSVPAVAFIVLILLWSKTRAVSFYVSAMVVLPVFYAAFLSGADAVDPAMKEMADSYAMKPANRFRYLLYPAVYPYLLGAASAAVGMGFKSAAAAEVIGQVRGTIGNGIYMAKVYLSAEELFAWTLAVVLLSWAGEKIVLFLLRKTGGESR
ncbi:MAG: ABC transporter permease subunit [Erysipelotrichales bacterium]|nr:ABC transporter permease subunit [Erysipelotrichales bacterium]MBQ1385765.1 ABC transporter permease subunit [Erysipelotrichales bacterium]MBQ4375840.1 ABC transporter permease subunit [Erysipelotrichales bacterium]